MNTAGLNLVDNTSKVSCGNFKHDYFDSQEYFDHQLGEQYIRHNINIYNKLSFKDITFDAMYQTGCRFRHGDYTLPCNNLELSIDDRTDRTLIEISQLSIDDMQDDISVKNIINFLRCPSVDSKEDLVELFNALQQNLADAKAYLASLDIDWVMSNTFTATSDQIGEEEDA